MVDRYAMAAKGTQIVVLIQRLLDAESVPTGFLTSIAKIPVSKKQVKPAQFFPTIATINRQPPTNTR